MMICWPCWFTWATWKSVIVVYLPDELFGEPVDVRAQDLKPLRQLLGFPSVLPAPRPRPTAPASGRGPRPQPPQAGLDLADVALPLCSTSRRSRNPAAS